MALTINTQPERIDNSATFNVTTSLSEDASHVNLRIRADIYHEGIIKATVEKPKGISDFDFSDILSALVPGLLFAKDSGAIVNTGSVGSNLLSSWASHSGTWTTLTKVANVINSAICTVSSELESNAVAMVPGELYLFYSVDYASSGTTPKVKLETGGAASENIDINKSYLLMPTTSASLKVILGGTGTENFSGTFLLYKITTNRSTTGNPTAPYFVNFIEIYESSTGVTTTGSSSSSTLCRFIPASEDIAPYLLANDASLFASKTLRNNICKFFTVSPSEYWLCFFSEIVEMELFYSKDGAGYIHTTHPVCYEGWGVVIINIGEIMSSVSSNLRIQMKDIYANEISEVNTIHPDTSQIDERVILEFDGLVGGKEYLAFEGIKDMSYFSERQYYKASTFNRKPLKLKGMNRQALETRFKDINNADYLKSLLSSYCVHKLDALYVVTDVTVLTDTVIVNKGSELFTNRIDIEYAN